LQAGWNVITSVFEAGDPDESEDGQFVITGSPITSDPYTLPSGYTWIYDLSGVAPPDDGGEDDAPLTDGYGFIFQGTLNDWDGPDGAQIVPLGYNPSSDAGSPVGYAASIDSATGNFDLSYYDGVEMAESGTLGTLSDFFNAVCKSDRNWTDPPEKAYISIQPGFQIIDADGNEIGSALIVPPGSAWFEFWYSDREEAAVGSCISTDGPKADIDIQLQAGWNTFLVVYDDNGTSDDVSDDKYAITATPISGDTYALPSDYTMEYHLNSSVSALGVPGLPAFLKPSALLSWIF